MLDFHLYLTFQDTSSKRSPLQRSPPPRHGARIIPTHLLAPNSYDVVVIVIVLVAAGVLVVAAVVVAVLLVIVLIVITLIRHG